MDSGTSGTVSGKHIPKARRKRDEQSKWNARGGTFNTKSKSKIYFRLPELDSTKDISHSLGFDRWDSSFRSPNSPTSDILCWFVTHTCITCDTHVDDSSADHAYDSMIIGRALLFYLFVCLYLAHSACALQISKELHVEV